MAGYIAEFFGYRTEDKSEQAITAATRQLCPFPVSYTHLDVYKRQA